MSVFPGSMSSRMTVIRPPEAGDRGTRCWRHILRHRRRSSACARVRAGRTWMALPPCSNETDTVRLPRYAICARRPTSAIFCKIEAEHWPTSIYRPFSSICEPAAVHGRRGKAQPPHLVRRQALSRLPGANRCLSMQRDAGASECRPGTRRRLPTVVAEASRCRRTHRQTVFPWCNRVASGTR